MSSEDPIDETFDEAAEQTEDRATCTDQIVERFIGYRNGVGDGGSDITQIGIFNKVIVDSEYNSNVSQDEDLDSSNQDISSTDEDSSESYFRREILESPGSVGLLGLGGLAGLTGLVGFTQLDDSEPTWEATYDVLAQDNLEEVSGDLTSSEYVRLNTLGHGINEAIDDHEQVALGLSPRYGDIGVRENSFEDFTLQNRYQLKDAYEQAKNYATTN